MNKVLRNYPISAGCYYYEALFSIQAIKTIKTTPNPPNMYVYFILKNFKFFFKPRNWKEYESKLKRID